MKLKIQDRKICSWTIVVISNTLKMTRTQIKEVGLDGFINDVWNACASGDDISFSKIRDKHSVTGQYAQFIKNECLTQKKGTRMYTVNKGLNKDTLAKKLSSLTIREMNDVLKGKLVLSFGKKKALKHLSDGDMTLSSTKFEPVELDTKKEVVQTTMQFVEATNEEVTDLTRKQLQNSELTIKVQRTYPGGKDSTQFIVKEGFTYDKLLAQVIGLKR